MITNFRMFFFYIFLADVSVLLKVLFSLLVSDLIVFQ